MTKRDIIVQGWIKLHRTLENHPFWLSEPFTKPQAWIDLLLLANHKDGYFFAAGRKVPVDRGQVGRSLLTLGKRWKWSRGKVDRYMEFLENEQMVCLQTGQHNSIVTICNYDSFQAVHEGDSTTDRTPDDTPDEHQTGQQTDTRQDTRQDTNKNVNNGNNVEKVKNVNKYSECFETFWFAYHPLRRGDKKRAYIEWKKIGEIEYPTIMESISVRATSDPQWINDEGKYLVHAERFLSGSRWQNPFTAVDHRMMKFSGKTQKSITAAQEFLQDG